MKVRRFSGTPEDWNLVHDICFNCGSETLKKELGFIQKMWYFHAESCIFDIFEDKAFYFGYVCKKHTRNLGIAVLQEYQNSGIASEITFFEKQKAVKLGIHKMTFKTKKSENTVGFHKKMGAKVTAEDSEHYIMEMNF